MEELLGPAFVKGVYAIFKGKPNQAYIVVVVITNIVLGIWVVTAKNPDDRTYGVIAIIFVFFATLGHIFNIMVQERLRGIQTEEEEPVEEETAGLPGPAPIELPVLAQEIPHPAANPPVPQVNQAASPVAPEKKKFSYYSLSGEDILRTGLICIFLLVIGYFSTFLLGGRSLLLALENSSQLFKGITDTYFESLIIMLILHMTFGLAGAFFFFSPVFVGLGLLLGFLFKTKPIIGRTILAITAFLFGILIFLPLHIAIRIIALMGMAGS